MTREELCIFFDKPNNFFASTRNPSMLIEQLYGELNVSNINKFNEYCCYLIDLINHSIDIDFISKRELTDVIYGKGKHCSALTQGMLKNRDYYTQYDFINATTFNNYQIAEKYIKQKYLKLKEDLENELHKQYI